MIPDLLLLASVLYPQYGIITNIGTAHIGILGSKQNIAEEKKQIFKFFNSKSHGYIPADDDFADFLAESKGEIKKVSQNLISDVKFLGLEGSSFSYKNQNVKFPLCGKYNLKNALSVIALAEDLGLSTEEIKNGLETVKTIFGRNQIVKKDFTFVLDCYRETYLSKPQVSIRKSIAYGGERRELKHLSSVRKRKKNRFSK